jgi:hypothetical protein
MLDLVIAACLAISGECRDFHLLYDPRDVSLMMCVAGGQVEIVDWQQSHPSWTVKRWRCGYQAKGVVDL